MQSKSKIKDLINKINDSIEGELTQNVLNQFNVLAKNAIGSMRIHIENENRTDRYGEIANILGIAIGIIVAAILLKVVFGLVSPTLIVYGGKNEKNNRFIDNFDTIKRM